MPFCCPYCGEEALEPAGESAAWYCSSCNRRFELRFQGLGEPSGDG
ncbi:MAG: Insertion element protein [Actinomycetota bacterium]